MAIAGEVDALCAFTDGDANGENDVLVYKWLCVASDFGHAAADGRITDLMAGSSLAYDDDQYETGHAHFELGVAYLRGTEGLPIDHAKARTNLEAAYTRNYPMSVQDGDGMLALARTRLVGDARVVFDAIYRAG